MLYCCAASCCLLDFDTCKSCYLLLYRLDSACINLQSNQENSGFVEHVMLAEKETFKVCLQLQKGVGTAYSYRHKLSPKAKQAKALREFEK